MGAHRRIGATGSSGEFSIDDWSCKYDLELMLYILNARGVGNATLQEQVAFGHEDGPSRGKKTQATNYPKAGKPHKG